MLPPAIGGSIMPSELAAVLVTLFDAERSVREIHDRLADSEPDELVPVLGEAVREALALDQDDDELGEDEQALRLVRIAALLGEMEGPAVVEFPIDILGCEDTESRHAAGEALTELAWDRFKEVALGVERALDRLPAENPALLKLPYLLSEVSEPGVLRLMSAFLRHKSPDVAAAAIEALVEMGDPKASDLLEPLANDRRKVQLEDDSGTEAEATLAELVAEARTALKTRTA